MRLKNLLPIAANVHWKVWRIFFLQNQEQNELGSSILSICSLFVQDKAGSVNIYPVGIIIHPKAFWLAASPDRRVYDPSSAEQFGLLEIKCPDMEKKSSLDEVDYLVKHNHTYSLKKSHTYYYQIQMQMAVTGLPWTDLYCWSDKITHLERIVFDAYYWSKVKLNIDEFYFSFFLQ